MKLYLISLEYCPSELSSWSRGSARDHLVSSSLRPHKKKKLDMKYKYQRHWNTTWPTESNVADFSLTVVKGKNIDYVDTEQDTCSSRWEWPHRDPEKGTVWTWTFCAKECPDWDPIFALKHKRNDCYWNVQRCNVMNVNFSSKLSSRITNWKLRLTSSVFACDFFQRSSRLTTKNTWSNALRSSFFLTNIKKTKGSSIVSCQYLPSNKLNKGTSSIIVYISSINTIPNDEMSFER